MLNSKQRIVATIASVILVGAFANLIFPQDLRWWSQNLVLSSTERGDLALITPEPTGCPDSSWDDTQLRWECKYKKGFHGPRAILPVSAAIAADRKRREESQSSCNPETAGELGIGGTPFRCQVINAAIPQKGVWVLDKVALELQAQRYRHQADLAYALEHRVISDKEMDEVLDNGYHLFVQDGIPFEVESVQQRFLYALRLQQQIRDLQHQKDSCHGQTKGPQPPKE